MKTSHHHKGLVILIIFFFVGQCTADSNADAINLRNPIEQPLSLLGKVARTITDPLESVAGLTTESKRHQSVEDTGAEEPALFDLLEGKKIKSNNDASPLGNVFDASFLGSAGGLIRLLEQGIAKFADATSEIATPEMVKSLQSTMRQASALMRTGADIMPHANNVRQLEDKRLNGYQPSTGSSNIISSLLGPLGNGFGFILNPLHIASNLFSPLNIFTNHHADLDHPMAVNDALDHLALASSGSNFIYNGLGSLESLLSAPLSMINLPLSILGLGHPINNNNRINKYENTHGNETLRSLGILGLNGLYNPPMSGLGVNETGIPLADEASVKAKTLVEPMRENADALTANLDGLLTLMSGGARNPLTVALTGISEAVAAIISTPIDALSWLGLTNSLQDTQGALRRMKSVWQLSDSQTNAVEQSISSSNSLLNTIGDHRGPLDSNFLTGISTGLSKLASNLLQLNGTMLGPNLNFGGVDANKFLGGNLQGLVELIISPATNITNAFGLPIQIAMDLARVPFELINLPMDLLGRLGPGTNNLQGFHMNRYPVAGNLNNGVLGFNGNLGDVFHQVLSIRCFLQALQSSFELSSGLLQTPFSILSNLSNDGLYAISKSLMLQNALNAATGILNSAVQMPFTVLQQFNPLSILAPVLNFGGATTNHIPQSYSSVFTPLEFRKLESHEVKSAGNKENHPKHDPKELRVIGHQNVVRRAADASHRAVLLMDEATLKNAASQLQHKKALVCEHPEKKAQTNIVKARALLGNPIRMLEERGVSKAVSHEILQGKIPPHLQHTTKPNQKVEVSDQEALNVCEIKKQAIETLQLLTTKLDHLASVVGQLAHAKTLQETHTTNTALLAQLQDFDIPVPPKTETL